MGLMKGQWWSALSMAQATVWTAPSGAGKYSPLRKITAGPARGMYPHFRWWVEIAPFITPGGSPQASARPGTWTFPSPTPRRLHWWPRNWNLGSGLCRVVRSAGFSTPRPGCSLASPRRLRHTPPCILNTWRAESITPVAQQAQQHHFQIYSWNYFPPVTYRSVLYGSTTGLRGS